MGSKCKLKVDFDTKKCIGIHLKEDYVQHHIICSMEGYIKQALEQLKHSPIAKHHYAPSPMKQKEYNACFM